MIKFMRSSWGLIAVGILFVLLIIGYNIYDNTVDKNADSYTSEQVSKMDVKKININTASKSELCELTSIGESTAQEIIDYRELNGGFRTLEELKNVKGIGEKTYLKIAPYITI